MIYKAQSPAGFAEEYIVESIWSGRFPPDTILPAERELSELIGVTRTTLREVLQRLARDGWLTIQHGKPTRVNNFWETSGLNILETLARLDQDGIPELVDHLLAARTAVSVVIIRAAIKKDVQKVIDSIEGYKALPDDGKAFAEFEYNLTHNLTIASGNPVYILMMNGFKGLFSRIGGYYFSNSTARELARKYYSDLSVLAQNSDIDGIPKVVRNYGIESGKVWQNIRGDMPSDLVD
ncbi:fatty acid metabolism transcriptional regulator FadR [Alteromonadaceae bacterium M269]|nr:fatty acid metabolism transcriptional regulator FadR [Alteromonadaceae bacterium M269]